ncbi:2-amino-4-hydroxy-6-hydroxymethyldihydropteridine diphosphokinase [Pelagibacterium montanilacus]|uniref:2-amino-4-hydroxy-6- hydroxymethyldihydropteridine diphosphokinase n=1 Tax=Pelagibacterium montanilacus TaxID=2185280 RepID=UPI000F8E7CE1|nr:2-amino-4-hydroxy-6-hydroxymethyldihydropteridine diphosphokinase [Pelagibacterium montanilacus]
MAFAILALGANLEAPAEMIARAIEAIGKHPNVALLERSTTIVTAPWGDTDQGDFHNAAIAIDTSLAPLQLLDLCLGTEAEMGRVRTRHWGPRVIDIDVIAYDRAQIETDRLTLPHPYAHKRDFVMVPVREIAPEVADWLLERKAPQR